MKSIPEGAGQSQNSKIQVPDYKNKRPIGSDNYTAPEDGYVRIQNQLTGHLVPLGTNVSAQIKINEETAYFFLIRIEESSSYLAIDSGLYPVKKGDSIEFLHLGSDTADRYFYPVL